MTNSLSPSLQYQMTNFCTWKYGAVYLLLVLGVLILLQHKELTEMRTFIRLKFESKVEATPVSKVKSPPTVSNDTHRPSSPCSFHPLISNNAVDLLQDLKSWPKTPPLPSPFSMNTTSDPAHSYFTVLPRKGGGSWHTGEELEVLININDFHGKPKKTGGDVLFARLYSQKLHAGVAGQVVDHLNGSYSAFFSLLWEGSAQVEVTLVHPSEAVTVLQKLTQEQPDRIYFQSLFSSGSVSQTTTCNVCLNATQEKVCNYTDLNTGEQWFCYKPKNLACDTRMTHAKGGFKQKLTPMEEKLFQRNVNMKVSIPALGPANITVLPKMKGRKNKTPKSSPSGYYYQGEWQALAGTVVQHFNNSTAMSQCLKGKVVHLYGDSTIRQWFEYLSHSLPDLKEFELTSSRQNGPFMALNFAENTLVTYHCHGPPIRFASVPVTQLRYVANELDRVNGGTNTVVVLSIWSHFSTFPIEVYIRRILSIRKAVMRLLTRAPGTLVVIRTANPKQLSLYEALTNSDWYSLQRDKVLRAIFKGVNVKLVDAWEMSLAHELPHSLHPQPPIIKNMIDVLLSYICPVARK
ncbi:NXPE family member 3 isoform X2 [Nothobranchius furzeri]